MSEPNKKLLILIEWQDLNGNLYLQEWTTGVVTGALNAEADEQEAVKKVIELLTTVERLGNKKIRSVRAVDKSKLDTYLVERIDRSIYTVMGKLY